MTTVWAAYRLSIVYVALVIAAIILWHVVYGT